MKERPVIFNAEMVKAILSGRKTQTRRPVKFPFIDSNAGCELSGNELAGEVSAGNFCNSPFGQPGDRLWVRETFGTQVRRDAVGGTGEFTVYRASKPDAVKYTTACGKSVPVKWKPSIHMPRWASRITLEITGVRVERLNSISEEDALAEGASPSTHPITPPEAVYRVGFGNLWREIYVEESWQADSWVWVIEFKRVAAGGN